MATVITLGDKTTYDPLKLWDQCLRQALPADLWFGKANRFTCAIGPEPGTGTLLMAAEDVTPLLETRPKLVFDDGEKRQELKNLVITAAETITWGVRGDLAALRVVTIKDRRCLLTAPIDRGYNLRDCSGVAFGGAMSYTWQTMVNDLWSAVGGIGTAPPLPFTPDGDPSNFGFFGYWTAWEALNLVLDRIGCAVKYDSGADTFSIIRLGAADAAVDSFLDGLDSSRLSDPEPARVKLGRVPKTLRVVFTRRPAPKDGTSPFYTLDRTVSGGGADGTLTVPDDLVALCDAANAVTNTAALGTRADERVADFAREWSPGSDKFNREYSGVIADPKVLPGSRVHAVAWGDVGRGLKTSVYRGEGVVLPEGLARKFRPYDPNCGGCAGTINEFLGMCLALTNNVTATVAASGTVTPAYQNLVVDASGGAVTQTMDDPATFTTQEVTILKGDSSANAVTVAPFAAETFTGWLNGVYQNAVSSLTLSNKGESVTLYLDDAGNWRVKAAEYQAVTQVVVTTGGILASPTTQTNGVSTTALSLTTQAANMVLAGPTSGGAATPTMRALHANDVGGLVNNYSPATPTDWSGSAPTTTGAALDRCAALLKTLNGGTGP